jgi:hypothetical protein
MEEQMDTEGQGGGVGQPLLIVATFAAGIAAALGTRALLARRKGSAGAQGSDEDLATALRRATLDVAIAATNQAAERLGQGQSETSDEAALPQS